MGPPRAVTEFSGSTPLSPALMTDASLPPATFQPSPRDPDTLRRRLSRWLVDRLFVRDLAAPGPLPATGVFRIVVCKVSHTLGNTLLLTPLLQELERRYPGAEVDIVTRNPVAGELFAGYPSLGAVYHLPAHALAHPFRVASMLRRLRATRYDLAIDADSRSQTGRLLVNLMGATRSAGYSSDRKRGHVSHPVPLPHDLQRESALPVHLLRAAMQLDGNDAWPAPQVRLAAHEQADGRERLRRLLADSSGAGVDTRHRPVIGIFANATGHKLIAADWWVRFITTLELTCPGHAVVEIVPMSGRSMLSHRYPAYYSGNIRRLAGVLAALSVYVSADCGIMHLANACAPRTIGLFDRTDPAAWGTYGPGSSNVVLGGRSPEQSAAEVAALIRDGAARDG